MNGGGNILQGVLDTPRLFLAWEEAPWDSAIFGAPVLQISRILVRDKDAAQDMLAFEADRDRLRVALVSCRMSCDQMRESILLEQRGFRFIEMLYQPVLADLHAVPRQVETGLVVEKACQAQLPILEGIAGQAFRNERFHVDPLLDPALGDQRYRSWVRNSFAHASQRLWAIRDTERIVAFFVTEMLGEGTCYWHLNAVARECQGQGYGKRVWQLMIEHARKQGASRIRTSIVARNYRVLNLYARLGFRFPQPLMTFHWVRGGK